MAQANQLSIPTPPAQGNPNSSGHDITSSPINLVTQATEVLGLNTPITPSFPIQTAHSDESDMDDGDDDEEEDDNVEDEDADNDKSKDDFLVDGRPLSYWESLPDEEYFRLFEGPYDSDINDSDDDFLIDDRPLSYWESLPDSEFYRLFDEPSDSEDEETGENDVEEVEGITSEPTTVDKSKGRKREASEDPDDLRNNPSENKRARLILQPRAPKGGSEPTQPEGNSKVGDLSSATVLSNPTIIPPGDKLSAVQAGPLKTFDIERILEHPDLCLQFATHLTMANLVDLYSISKTFHQRVNNHYTTYIQYISRVKAPDAMSIFPFRYYARLCTQDPAGRPHPVIPHQIRTVPSLRYLQMVVFRSTVVQQIMILLAHYGHRFPRGTRQAILKIGFMMDLPTNALRIGVIHNSSMWTDRDLILATTFFVKLDMLYSHPFYGRGGAKIRKLLMGQRQLTRLWHALRREELMKYADFVQMQVAYDYQPFPQDAGMSIFGVPADLVGRGCLEGWGAGHQVLLRPDEVVAREAVRRGLRIQTIWPEAISVGYQDLRSKRDLPKLPWRIVMASIGHWDQ